MIATLTPRNREYTIFHVAGGIGLGARGFADAISIHRHVTGSFRTLGSVDVDPVACRIFGRLVGVPATVLDLFTREQYTAFHGKEPPAEWREATGGDLRKAAGNERPNVVFSSSPCKGLSALLNNAASGSAKYQALNGLVERSIDLVMDAWGDDPPEFILIENVPRILTRGRELLDNVKDLLDRHNYASAETCHDCGELGGLAQHRQRFLLVARHRPKVRPHLWEPPKKRVRGVGEVLGALPMPDAPGIPMHRLPRLKWLTWVRLALIEAGSDWRSLNRLAVEDGYLKDIGIVPVDADWYPGVMGVGRWDRPSATVTGRAGVTTGQFSVADPRCNPEWARHHGGYGTYGVNKWDEPAPTVSGSAEAGSGRFSVADPRTGKLHNEAFGVSRWEDPAATQTGEGFPSNGRFAVADPRCQTERAGEGKYKITGWDMPAGCVIAGSTTGNGAFAVADPRTNIRDGYQNLCRTIPWDQPANTVTGATRPAGGAMSVADPRLRCDASDEQHRRFNNCYRVVQWDQASQAVTGGGGPSAGGQAVADPRVRSKSEDGTYVSARHYGVLRWDEPSPAVTGSACHDNGAHSVADPRHLPGPNDRALPFIVSLDGTWHRPFTTFEIGALQGFPVVECHAYMEGSDSMMREHFGNGVPRETGEAIGATMLFTMLMAEAGETFTLSAAPIWVVPRPDIALAIGVDVGAA